MQSKLFCAIILLSLIGLPAALTACNTVQGFGQDLKTLGSAMERKAAQKKRY